MKDYIYPLHNVTLSIALGEERTARMYSPTPASGLFLQGENKKKHFFAVRAASRNQNKQG